MNEHVDMAKRLIELGKQIRDSDPLLEKGIERDWVCVINPAQVRNLLDYAEQMPWYNPTFPEASILRSVTGRETWIINDCKPGQIEYMPKYQMYVRYSGHFLRNLKLRESDLEDES